MTDLAWAWKDETYEGDLELVGGDLATDAGLRTAVILSLFTDRRAAADDELPQPDADPRGWWGDMFADPADAIGSRLWLLARSKRTPEVAAKAREYIEEALAWLLRDGVAARIDVETEVLANGWLGFGVSIERPAGPNRQRYDFVWKGV